MKIKNLTKAIIIHIIYKYSHNNLKIICINNEFGRFEFWVKKNNLECDLEEGMIILVNKLNIINNVKFIEIYKNLFYIDNKKNNYFIYKLILKMIYIFVFNIDEIRFFFRKDFFGLKYMRNIQTSEKIMQIFLKFEFWILFFVINNADYRFKTSKLKIKFILIYKRFLKNNETGVCEQKIYKISKYFERIWLLIERKSRESNNFFLSNKIQSFLKFYRKNLYVF